MFTTCLHSRRFRWAAFVFPALLAAAGALTVRQAAANSAVGAWSAMQSWPIVAVHAHLLPNGKVMFYPYGDDARQWDPATGGITSLARVGYNIFCTGHSLISDGRLFVTGGHIANNVGLNDASYYNYTTNTWTRLADMNAGRWYPTNTTLANGEVLVVTGDSDVGVNDDLPQVWQVGSGTWRNLTSARLVQPLYVRMFLAPNGQVFAADSTSRYLNTSGTGSWSTVGSMRVGGRNNYGSAAMYEPGKIIFAGGVDPPVSSAEIIDLNAATPAWSLTGSMANNRRQLNVTILADGKILATGGSSASGFNNPAGAVHAAELWNPATGTWSTMASCTRYRGYHSTALLLPDGRVLCAGGDNEPNAEVYSPTYLFNGSRPTISSSPATVNYGQTFFLGTPEATSITKITFIRLGSATHANNMNQRLNNLTFSQVSGGLHVTLPANGNACPPGHYMLFILNGSGVPSVSKITRIYAGLPSPWLNRDVGAVAIAGSASASGGVFTVNGSGADIWGTADEFHYVYQSGSGDCSVTARVTAQGNTNAWAKAGVMIRESMAAGSKHAMMVMTPGNGLAFQYRASTNGSSTHVSGGAATLPIWVRIVRTGSTFTGYKSTNGTSWTTVGSATITMGTSVQIGLADTSHSDGALSQATFDNVTASP